MIKGSISIDGIHISNLSVHSHKKVIKICDFCGKEKQVALREINKSRSRTKHGKDACHKCAQKFNGEARRKGFKLVGDGYLAIGTGDNRELAHRSVIADSIGRPLTNIEIVHHIDGDKLNNDLNNLFLCSNSSIHSSLHYNLEQIAMKLVKDGTVRFNKNGFYYIANPTQSLEHSLGFESISIKQKKNKCLSRLDVNTQSEIIRGIKIDIPLIASNMSTVINSDFYLKLYKAGAFGFLHRALSEQEYFLEVIKVSKECPIVPVSIGVGQDQYELAKKLISRGANVILIDIAHGYSDSVIDLGRRLKREYPHIKMVVGNTVNVDMMYEVADFADAVKCGIAQGFACETKNTAGCTEKQFSAVLKFKNISKKLGIPIISDGGLREPADLVKSIAAGANSAMAGSIFASCPESAGEIVEIDGKIKKLYAGMASEYVQNKWKGGLKPGTCAEGGIRYLDMGDPLSLMLETWQGALKSGITYGGGVDIKSFQECVEFIRLI